MKVEEDFKVIEHYLCIKMPREVDHHNAGNIAEQADEMICKSEVKNLIFDFSDTEFIKSFTTLKLTSASRRANLTSRIAPLRSASEILPLPRSFLNVCCNLSARFSNANLCHLLFI